MFGNCSVVIGLEIGLNFYKHHLGDYDGHTAHLSWDEDMAYTRLMRAYYRRELPIPEAEAYRLCRASTKTQKEAVDSVLREFFKLIEGGWCNKRCDEEITAYQAQASTNRRIARQRTVERIVNEPLDEPSTKRIPNQIPDTKNQEPNTKAPAKRAVCIPEDFSVSDRVRGWAEREGHLNLEKRLQHFTGYARANAKKYADWDQAFMNAIRDDWAKLTPASPTYNFEHLED